MDKISTRAFPFLEAVAQQGEVDLSRLLGGLPPLEAWRAPDQFVTWAQFKSLTDRLAVEVGGHARLAELSRRAVVAGTLSPMAGLLPDVLSLYEFLARFAGPSLFRCVRFTFGREPEGAASFSVQLEAGLEPSPAFLTLVGGALGAAPLALDLPAARVVELERTERGATWLVSPQGGAAERGLEPPHPQARELMDQLYTQQQRLGDALAERKRDAARSEADLAALLDALPDLVMRYDRDSTLVAIYGGALYPNREVVEAVVGLSVEAIQARWGITTHDSARTMREGIAEARRTRQPVSRSVVSRAVDRTPRSLLFRFVPHGDDVLVVSHDRTNEAKSERRLKVVERMASLGELAAGVAHEINNPLTAVLGSLSVLEQNLTSGGSRDEALALVGELAEGCRRIRDTAARMREFSHVQPPSRGLVKLLSVVERADRMTRTELRYRARVELEVDPALAVVGDADELTEVLVNLLTNAAQAMPQGASPESHSVRVRGRAEAEAAVLEVTDDGVGIPPESLSRIFDPYFTTRVRREGAGFGLAICHRIVTAHGGTIEASSEPGRTTLTIRLPRAAVPLPVVEPGGAQAQQRRARVLVIDDEPSVGRAIRRALAEHDVEVVGDGRAAFSLLRDGELPDVVLCDLMMPGFTGMELWAALKHARPEALERMVFISGGTFTPAATEFLRDTPVQVLNKPFTDGQLEELVRQVLLSPRP